MEHLGTPATEGTTEAVETPLTKGKLTTVGMPATAGTLTAAEMPSNITNTRNAGNTSSRMDLNSSRNNRKIRNCSHTRNSTPTAERELECQERPTTAGSPRTVGNRMLTTVGIQATAGIQQQHVHNSNSREARTFEKGAAAGMSIQ
jgi:hypothetical protein